MDITSFQERSWNLRQAEADLDIAKRLIANWPIMNREIAVMVEWELEKARGFLTRP